MRLQHPNGATVYICDFCGMSSTGQAGPQLTHSGDAVICEPCVRLAAEIFRRPATPSTTQEVTHG